MTNEVLSVISARRSHRAYLPDRIPEEKLTAILQAGLEAPSAVNRQPWLYTVVEDQALLQEIHNATAEGMTLRDPSARSPRFADSAFHVFYHAPAVIFIFGEKNFGWTSVDCGIAVQNMALAAESLGLGTVILGLPQAAFGTDKADTLREKLYCPDTHDFVIALAIGTPADTKDAHPQHPEKITYIR